MASLAPFLIHSRVGTPFLTPCLCKTPYRLSFRIEEKRKIYPYIRDKVGTFPREEKSWPLVAVEGHPVAYESRKLN